MRFWPTMSSDAYEKLVDRLLDSPRYGEHMAVAWLDAARYADTDGYQNDRYRYMHVWRDWVVLALNDNKPYDEFLVEQLAGDMLPDATLKQQIATGFCRNHRINSEDGSIPQEWHVENVVDRVDTLGTAILGLTIGCARCHDHKYDPLSAREYYQLFAYFNNVPEWGVGPNNGNSPPFVKVPESWPALSPEEDVAQVPEPLKLGRARKEAGNGLQRPQAGDKSTVMVMQEMEKPRPTYLLERGQFNTPDESEVLTPDVPRVLQRFAGASPAEAPRDRLGLAKWLVNPKHPLTSRVAVNRMWQQFFGAGLVRTAENFGLQGELPSHPELLDWLAVQFVESGWDVKATQKLILMSGTYRQSSRTNSATRRDRSREPLARPRPAFAAASVRAPRCNAIQQRAIGREDRRRSGDAVHAAGALEFDFEQQLQAGQRRAALSPQHLHLLATYDSAADMVNFNAAEREVCVVRKQQTNTPLQALTLMNNITFAEASRFLAERMMQHSADDRSAIDFGFRQLVSRRPTADEFALLEAANRTFLETFGSDKTAALELLSVGEKPRDKTLDPVRHAALTMTASLMMNLDEAITKE